MLSRIAENLFWMGRYIERAENTSRLLNVNYLAIIEVPPELNDINSNDKHSSKKWLHLLEIMESDELFKEYFNTVSGENVLYWLALHKENPASIRSSLSFARENARILRDRISSEMWEAINSSYHNLCEQAPKQIEEDILYDYCETTREASHLFFGIAHATLPHDLEWYFLRAGQFLERADNTLRTLQAHLGPKIDTTPIEAGIATHKNGAILKSFSAFEAYRKFYAKPLNRDLIYEFLLFNKTFPRSVLYSLTSLETILSTIQSKNENIESKTLASVVSLNYDIHNLSEEVKTNIEHNLDLNDLIEKIGELSHQMREAYFVHKLEVKQEQNQSS